ncbi:hypothetical protein HID58_005883 [Brassica napus]|uniref:Uncharacterized protein n=1 Tax=Brassica napus TaxID=3708 RepID=A0ABQ8EAK0_BRANA|nr:hypothetical protein HID58_005883 [Brassica napus]
MGNTDKLMNQIFDLKFTSKSLQRQSRKCEKEEKAEKLKVKKAIEKGNMDGARIYAENAIRKRSEQMNYLRLASRLDAVVARLDTQAKMATITKSMTNIVKSLESSLATGNLQKMSETMDSFEKQFVNMEEACRAQGQRLNHAWTICHLGRVPYRNITAIICEH